MKTALVVGASGLTGNELVQQLLDDPYYQKVILLVRKSMGLKDQKLEEMIVDFDRLKVKADVISGANHVFCCLGTTIKTAGSREAFRKVDYSYPVELARLCEFTSVSHFLMVSAMGAKPASSIFYNQVKGQAENAIKVMKIPAITFFRPSLLVGDRKEKRMGEKTILAVSKGLAFVMKGPLKNYKPVTVKDVAAAMVNEAKKINRAGVRFVMSGAMQGMYAAKKPTHAKYAGKVGFSRVVTRKIPVDE